MTTVNIYVTYNGNCEEAFGFYKSIFGGEFSYVGRFKDMPPMDGKTCPPEDDEKIMHIGLPISKETQLMGCDSSDAFGQATTIGNNFSISINTDSKEEADRLFNGLSEGGIVTMPMNNTFWGDYFGMFTDKYKINWLVSFAANQNQ
jgi:PhnB protein